MPDPVHEKELELARTEGRLEALEQAQARQRKRDEREKKASAPPPVGVARIARGLKTTNDNQKENDR